MKLHTIFDSQETYAEPTLAILGLNLIAVAHPVPVPAPQSSRVVNTNGVDGLDLEASALELVHNEAQRSTGISTGEDVLVHEQAPDEVLVLPGLAETSYLQEKDTVVLKHVVDLTQERGEVTDTNVLSHLETGDLLVAAVNPGSITVVRAQNTRLGVLNASLAKAVVAPGGLIAPESDTSDFSTVVDGSVLSKSAPATAKVENLVAGLHTDLLTDNGQLVVLELLEGLFLVDVADDTRGVNHTGTKEPSIKVITSVVVVTNLFLVCSAMSA